ncbi:MAG: type II toxin-antitoxin system YafQ family toxin [Spirochaetaceae bacterium]|nr:type II toxin-antitoxin system YafQ family toxin [Spirochaetaceae bacterium]MBP5793267.1 type II toxin-antitoxin system YafQ family toxin [Spirochaetaceae bacterium]
MRKLKTTGSFRTDLKKLSKQEIEETKIVVTKLQNDIPLEAKYRDHELHGNYEGCRECHIRPDLLLVYSKGSEKELLILTLYRINSHTNIFDTKKNKR